MKLKREDTFVNVQSPKTLKTLRRPLLQALSALLFFETCFQYLGLFFKRERNSVRLCRFSIPRGIQWQTADHSFLSKLDKVLDTLL